MSGGGSSPPYEAAERERAQEPLESARQDGDVTARLRWRKSASVGRGLHELAEVLGADPVAVGSSRRGVLGRVLLGDDTHTALNGARAPSRSDPA
jgi:nucleotide-binding universal stress UspA family protein